MKETPLDRLLARARDIEAPAEMPFGFDTRVLAQVRANSLNGSAVITRFLRQASALASIVIALGAIGVYRSGDASANDDDTSGYGMADTAIESNLSE